MASQSLYRKWRSQTFSDLIGQEAVVRTLLNAVRERRLAHAYLFCGPRGTGKTSVARLLAKAINCQNPQDGEPCNNCLSCQEITSGRSPDVIEIDAASNTGVDNIRDIRENVNMLGVGGHYKVYVVDECFSYGELVTLADGSQQPIGKLVESQWQGEVLSYNTHTGAIEPKPIVRHMKKPATVPTVKVTFDNNRSIVCTINHKFYTPQGQVCAGHLEVGQFVYTNRERISQGQRMVIMGAAPGNGSLDLAGNAMRGHLRLARGRARSARLDYKVKPLGNLVRGPARYQSGERAYSRTGAWGLGVSAVSAIVQVPSPEFVYNLEVADNHNYFVRDTLVSNCHMLSISAFNALLKTLEEPPPHVIFVLATTEAHKVLPTVVSRCQRFDFRRFGIRDIVARLEHVARGEGLELEPAAAELLARAAQGGMRDALSLLDQAITFCGSRIDLERARAMLGLADVTALRRLIACVADDRPANGLEIINDLVASGADLRQLNGQLAEEWRALMLARAGGDLTHLMEYTSDEARDLTALAERFTLEQLMASARAFTHNEGPAHGLPVPQLALELSFLECVSVRRGVTPTLAISAQPADTTQVAPPQRPQAPRAASPRPEPRPEPKRPVEELDLAAIDAGTLTEPAAPPAQAASAAMDPASTGDYAPVEEPAPAVGQDGHDWVEEARRQWALIRKVCKQRSGVGSTVYGLLNDAEPLRLEPGSPPTLILAARHDFHLRSLREDPKREVVEWALGQTLGTPFHARFVLAGEAQPGMSAVPARRAPAPSRTVEPAPSSPVREDSGAYRGAPPSPPPDPRAAVNGNPSRPAEPEPAPSSAPPASSAASLADLDQAAREDPVVQEFVRHGLEVAEVRPLDQGNEGSRQER